MSSEPGSIELRNVEGCNYSVPKPSQITPPTSISHSAPFKCPYPDCSRSYTREANLSDHIRGPCHKNEKPFKCDQCGKAFTRANDLDRHKRESHGSKKFICEGLLPTGVRYGCWKRFSRAATLKTHQKECASYKKANSAESSQFTFPSIPATQLQKEMNRAVISMQPDWQWHHTAEEFSCKICQARRKKSRLRSFVQHLLDHLESIEYHAFKCGDCGAEFPLAEHLSRHKANSFDLLRQAERPGPNCNSFNCQMLGDGLQLGLLWGCSDSFGSQEEFIRHNQGLDGTTCHGLNFESEQKLKNCILAELRSLGVPLVRS